MTDYEYKKVKVSQLSPYAKNSRMHSDKQVEQICRSISEFGFTNPVLIDESETIIAGHCRILAAKKLGIDYVPAVVLSGLSEQKRKAYVIADNQIALNSEWDIELLNAELESLISSGFDMSVIGFDDNDENPDCLPEVEEGSLKFDPILEVVVECDSESEQNAVYNLITERGFKCRILSM